MATTNTRTIKTADGDYTSLSNWEAGRAADLPSGDIIEVAECYTMEDTTAVVIDGWTTDATRYIDIHAAVGERHSGYWDEAKYFLSNAAATLLAINEEYVRVTHIQFELTTNACSYNCVRVGQLAAASDVRLGYNLYKGILSGPGGATSAVLASDDADGNCVVTDYNSVVIDFYNITYPTSTTSEGWMCAYGIMTLLNCTAYHCGKGFSTLGSTYKITAYNCLSYCDEVNSSLIDFAGTYEAASDYNASTDATAPDGGGHSIINQANTDIDFLSTTPTDATFLAIDSTSSCVGAGTDNPGSGLYSDDIRGVSRTSTWDIGADEYVAAGGGLAVAVVALLIQRQNKRKNSLIGR